MGECGAEYWMVSSGSFIFVNDPPTSSDWDASIKNHYDLFGKAPSDYTARILVFHFKMYLN